MIDESCKSLTDRICDDNKGVCSLHSTSMLTEM